MNIPLNIDWQQILLHVLNLVLLVGGLYFILYKPVKKFMDDREAGYARREDEVRAKEEAAQKLLCENEERARASAAEAQRTREAAQAQASEEARAIVEAAHRDADRILSDARERAKREEQRILRGAQGEITELSVEAAHKLMNDQLNDVYDRFLDAVEGSEHDARS